MPLANEGPINSALRRFDQLSALDDGALSRLAEQVQMHSAAPGARLLDIGSSDSRLLFLIDGTLELVAADGAKHLVRHTDAAAQGPVSRLRPSRYQVTADSEVRYLWVEQQLLDSLVDVSPAPSVVVEENYVVDEPNVLIDASATHALMFDVFDDLNHGRIVVPSDPQVAMRVGRALSAHDADLDRIADTLSVCPALTLKAVRTAFETERAKGLVLSSRQAVAQLGADRIYALTVNCVLRESLRSDSGLVNQRMQGWWRRTMRVSAICRVLAQTSERFDPDFAALIGLLHSIAEPVMLGYADRHPDLDDATALDNVVFDNRAELGRILLSHWHMPQPIVDAATHCNHWGFRHPGEADYTDITLVAQWHAMIGGEHHRPVPRLADIPAFRKLGLDTASAELSQQIVETANNAIERTEALLRHQD